MNGQHIGLIVKDISLLAQRNDVKNVQYISSNSDGSMWITAIVNDINELRKDTNVIHIEQNKPVVTAKRTNMSNFY